MTRQRTTMDPPQQAEGVQLAQVTPNRVRGHLELGAQIRG